MILGKGEEQRDITETANRLRITDIVIGPFEFVPEEERIAHYAASDICICPSLYGPFGKLSLEAMAMAKPVVVGARGVVDFENKSYQLNQNKTVYM